jgi:pimeloyl-ACP methyl ester carboxylesterase
MTTNTPANTMLHTTIEGPNDTTALVLMHFLGGSGREWDEVVAQLGVAYKTVRIDLPGFGGSADIPGYTIEEMADAAAATIEAAGLKRYVLVGHSMSGTVAMVLARRAQDAADERLAGLVLVAPSPPGPEPMDDSKRSMMVGLLGERHEDDRARARAYITKNELRDIPPSVEERASQEVLRMNRTAWVAWVTKGSKEDWTQFIGVLDIPALVIAGEKDLSLGPKQQVELTLTHLRRGDMVTVKNCSHLVPMEQPDEMTALLRGFLHRIAPETLVPEEYRAFIDSERLSDKTRAVMHQRMNAPADAPGVLNPSQMVTLRAMLARVIPQEHHELDLAGYVLVRLASGKGDGWRYDVLPEDVQAYREGLDKLTAQGFLEMAQAEQDAALKALDAEPGSADARWFEEVRGDAVSAYMAHPATMARIGYSGIGVGGAETNYKGFVTLGPNQRESWEPEPAR